MARVLVAFDDLLLGSNVLGMLRAAGHDAHMAGPAQAQPGGYEVLVVDLMAEGADGILDRLRDDGARALGVYAHTEHEVKLRAEAAGFDLVVPRSRMAREGPALVEGLVSRG